MQLMKDIPGGGLPLETRVGSAWFQRSKLENVKLLSERERLGAACIRGHQAFALAPVINCLQVLLPIAT